jgi:hypothetical protein
MYNSTILDLVTRYKVVSFTLQPFYRQINRFRYPLDKNLGRPHILSGRCGKEKILAMSIEPGPSSPVTRCYTDRATENPGTSMQYIILSGTVSESR